MIPGLNEVDAPLAHEVDDAVFLGEPARPSTGELILQRFRLADVGDRIAQGCFDDVEGAQRGPAVIADPESQVLEKLRVENGQAAC
jgi:hypothetical protein